MTTLILGIGNYLMGDEGVGVHAVRSLDASKLPDGAAVLDGGTGGFHLLGHIQGADRVIMIDAAADGKAPGTVSVLYPRYASDYPATLTAHDIGLKDLLDAMHLLGDPPNVILVTVSIGPMGELGTDLSPIVASVLPSVHKRVHKLLSE